MVTWWLIPVTKWRKKKSDFRDFSGVSKSKELCFFRKVLLQQFKTECCWDLVGLGEISHIYIVRWIYNLPTFRGIPMMFPDVPGKNNVP